MDGPATPISSLPLAKESTSFVTGEAASGPARPEMGTKTAKPCHGTMWGYPSCSAEDEGRCVGWFFSARGSFDPVRTRNMQLPTCHAPGVWSCHGFLHVSFFNQVLYRTWTMPWIAVLELSQMTDPNAMCGSRYTGTINLPEHLWSNMVDVGADGCKSYLLEF